jgi:hypothetical protein
MAIRPMPRQTRSIGSNRSRSRETRNYVKRVMKNLQVDRARFGGASRRQIEAGLRRAATAE